MEENTNLTVPYIVFEGTQVRHERTLKRLVAIIIVAIALLFASNAIWPWTRCKARRYGPVLPRRILREGRYGRRSPRDPAGDDRYQTAQRTPGVYPENGTDMTCIIAGKVLLYYCNSLLVGSGNPGPFFHKQ